MRGNFVSPIGNPYYEPDYENYYHNPSWYDRAQDPESWHGFDQTTRSAARAVGPLLPAVAVAVPAALIAHTAYDNYNRLTAKRAKREAKELQIQTYNKKIDDVIDEVKRLGVGPMITQGEQSKPPSTERQPPRIPSFHVDLPDKIYKMSVGGEDKINSSAEEIVHQIDMHGYDPVLKTLKKDSPFRTILEDIPGALLGPDYFPKPFYRYLDEETRERYSKVHKPKDYIGDDARRRERDGDHEANRYLEMHPSTKQKLDAARKKQSVVQNISSKPRSKRNRSTPRTSRGEKSSSLVSLVPTGIVRTPEGMRMLRIQTLMQMGMSREDAIRSADSKVGEVSKQFNK